MKPHLPIISALLFVAFLSPLQAELISDAEAKKEALKIDTFIARGFKNQQLKVPGLVDDTTFLRRSFLTIAGRIPTLDEVRFFVDAEDANKRDLMINYLLESPGYDSHTINWMNDLFRVTDRISGNGRPMEPYVFYFRNAVKENKPWDRITQELLSAKGSAWENGAVGYFVRDKGMEKDNLAITMKLFTGTQMECSQCHDDPFGGYDQMDFYHLVGFVDGQHGAGGNTINRFYQEGRRSDEARNDLNTLGTFIFDEIGYSSLVGGGNGRTRLPNDYQYSDGEPREMIGARTPFGKRVRSSAKKNTGEGRQDFAEWMVQEKNVRFTQTIVNRLWERVMGTPIYGPVDEYREPDETKHQSMLLHLNQLMRKLNYDMKSFQKVLFFTRTYQFDSNPQQLAAGKTDFFNGRQLRRLSPEQLWDSLITLQKGNPDKLPTRRYSDAIFYRGKPVLVGKKSMKQLSQEVLAIKDYGKYRSYVEDLLEQIKQDTGSSSEAAGGGMMMMASQSRRGGLTGIARASELRQPVPNGHLLREFGLSDRTLVEGNSDEANVGQILNVLNGHVQDQIINNPSNSMFKLLGGLRSPEDRIRGLFLSILTRPPSPDELALMMGEVKRADDPDEAYRNIATALLCTHEFLFLK